MAVALPTGALTYAAFCAEPSRFDIYLFDIAVPNENGAWQTLRWSNDEWSTGPGETPASVYWEPRVAEGGVDYETPAFDPSNPQFGLLPPVAPAPLVVLSRDGDLDAMMHWQWSRARVTVRHGGYTSSGRVPTSSFATIGTHELDGVPTFASDRATFYLRSLDSRFLDRVERRVLHAHPGALEFDGVDGTVNFAPFAPGIRLRWEDDRTYSATAPITYERTQDVHEGDLMLALIAHHGNTTAGDYESWAITAAPSGWTLVEDSARLEAGPGDPIHRIYLYSKVATSSEPTSYTWSATNTVGHVPNRVLGFSVWYGQDGTTPTISPAADDGSSTSLTAPAATSTRINSVYLGAIVSRGQLGNPASAPPHPTGTQSLHRLAKAGGTPPGSSWQRNSVGMQAFYQYLPSTGSSGTKTITMTGGSTPAWASLACILHNREAGGQPSKLKLQNALTLQFALVPMGDLTSADQHIVGWNQAAPWRLVLNDSAHLELQWVKGSTPAATEFDDITLEADHRYHVELIWSATQQILRVYDWITDTLTEQSESVAALSRDNPGGDDVYTIGCGAQSDGETPELPFDGQVWSLRLWNTAKTREFLDGTRVRELTHPERIDSTLVHYIPFEERTGDIVGDLSPNPADGELQSAGESNTPVWRPTLTGEADHAGEQVTCVFGHGVEYVPGQEVDSRTDGSFYLANVMPSSAVTAVYEGGAPRDIESDFFVPAPEENAYRTFLDALPEPGTVAVYSGPMGTFYRFRTRPVLPVSCSLNGYISPEFASEVGTVGPWSAAAVAYTVLTQRGEQPIDATSEVDDAAWLALATAQPEMSGTMVLPDESITDFCRRVLGGVLGLAWTDRSGLLTCRRWDPVTYSAETPAIHLHSDVIAAGTLQAVQVAQPVIMVRTRTRRNWMPLERDQISGDVTQPATIRRLMTEWVEGAQRPHAVAAIYPHGREVEIEAYFTGPGAQAAMAAVATRLREMYQSAGQTFECSARMLSVRPELGDQATLHVTDLTFEQNDRSRLVTFDGCRFRVAYARSERRRGLETLRLWRGEMTTQQESEDIES